MIPNFLSQKWALIMSLVWALISTGLYVKETRFSKPKIESPSASLLADSQVGFMKRFVSQYLSYTPDSFRRNQTALAYSLVEPLRSERLKEIERFESKIQEQNLEQSAEVLQINELAGVFSGAAKVVSGQKVLLTNFRIALSPAYDSMSGSPFLIRSLDFSSLEEFKPSDANAQILILGVGKKVVLDFPCAVENIERKKEEPLEIKITTLNVSEIQVLAKNEFPELKLKANCKDRSFVLTFTTSIENQTLYRMINLDSGSKIGSDIGKRPKQSVYKKTLEDELGFVIED